MSQGKPPKNAITLRPGNATTPPLLQVNAWALEAPPVEYFADTCTARLVDGNPTLFFAQRGLDDQIVNAIAIVMPQERFKEMATSFEPVLEQMSPELIAAGRAMPDEPLGAVPAGNFRKFFASMVRGGAGADHAMIDFYRVSLATKEQLQHGVPTDLIQGHVRVFTSPSTLAHLFHILESKGLTS